MKRKIKNLYRRTRNIFHQDLSFRRSIFAKYFVACASIIFLSIFFLGTILIVFSVRYSNSEKHKTYFDVASNVASYTAGIYGQSGYSDLQKTASLKFILQIISKTVDANIYIVDTDGSIGIYSINTKSYDPLLSGSVPANIMKTIKNNKVYSDIGTFGGVYHTNYNIVGVPIQYPDGSIIGGVFVSSQADNLIHFVYDIFKIFLICCAVVLLFSFVIIYFVTLRLVRPLRKMSEAVKSFATGDFSKRVPVVDKDEMGQLAISFNNMASSLSSLEEMRRSFVANVSHELRTPMTSIAGFIDGILDGTIPEEKQSYYLKIVSDEIKRLSRLVRSFLDIAKIEAGEMKVNFAEFDVAETARRVLIAFEKQITEKNLEIKGMDFDDKIIVSADPDLTHQVIYNLVDNAIKFAGKDGYIEINIANKEDKVYVGIKNSGMGIPSADIPYVFDRFYKTDKSRGLDKKGVGLGLYIVKSIINLQGEDIVVKSEETKYCEFVFTLKKA